MTPVDQDRFFDKEKGTRGNCLQACLATLLDFPLKAVPNFAEMPAYAWQESMYRWLSFYGLDALQHFACDPAPNGVAMATGPSPRGVRHSVVFLDGVMAHDPHPSRAGLLSIDSYWTIVPLTEERAKRMEDWK